MSAAMPARTPPGFRPRLLLSDVDGTLLGPDKELTPRAIAAVRALAPAGIRFAVTSGRPPRGLAMLLQPLAITTPLAGFNGGVYVTPALQVIESHALPAEVAREALRLLGAAGLDVWLYTADKWLLRNATAAHVAREARTVGYGPEVVAEFSDAMLAQAVKLVGVAADPALVAAAATRLQQALGARASATRSQPYYLDVTHPLANKGEVVARMSALLGVPMAAIATIGDMPNDMRMFARAGLAIAMGNAEAAVKQAAQRVTVSNAADGFAKAVEELLRDFGAANG